MIDYSVSQVSTFAEENIHTQILFKRTEPNESKLNFA